VGSPSKKGSFVENLLHFEAEWWQQGIIESLIKFLFNKKNTYPLYCNVHSIMLYMCVY
jgi:hypothetical protein